MLITLLLYVSQGSDPSSMVWRQHIHYSLDLINALWGQQEIYTIAQDLHEAKQSLGIIWVLFIVLFPTK